MTKTTYQVDGIHCASCEILIEEKLEKEEGIKKIDVDLAKKQVEIQSDWEIDIKKLNDLFKKSGYKFRELGESLEKEKENKWWWAPAVGVVLVFLILNKLGLGSFLNINSQSSLITFFILGIIAGISTCGALLSGIIISYRGKTLPLLIGRVVGYTILGAILGTIGQKIAVTGLMNVLIVVISVIMAVVGLQMLGIKWAQKIKINLPKVFTKKIISDKLPIIIGLLTVFLPCGFTLLTESVAVLSGNWVSGMLIMLVFVLGTCVPLFIIGLSSEKLMKSQKTMGLLILFFVLYNLNFQYGIIQRIFSQNTNTNGTEVSNQQVDVVKASYTRFGGLSPYTLTVKKGHKIRIEIDVKENEYGCMSTIMLPGLFNRAQTLTAGKTLIMEFTPTKVGTYGFTCAMGVPHKGEVNVIE